MLPWYEHILIFGRWRSAEASFANYSPPYIYLLCIASSLHAFLGPVAIIKLVDLPFVLLAAGAAWITCRSLGCGRTRSALASALIAFLPEICENCWRWGQCDVIYTSLLLVMSFLLLRRNRYLALAVLGIALAFKLQAIFVGPVIVALLFAGELPVSGVIVGLAFYGLMFVPAHWSGRSWHSLAKIYSAQYGYYNELTMGAPNIFVPVELIAHHYPATVHAGLTDANATRVGLLLAVLFSAALILFLLRHRSLRTGVGLLMSLSASLIGLPYLLPKMHERYFIAGDTLLALVAVVRPRLLIPAAMMQASLLLAYEPFLAGRATNRDDLRIPFLLTTCAIVLLVREMMTETRVQRLAEPASAVGVPVGTKSL